MKKILIATALTLMCSAAFAQTSTGPAAQSETGTNAGMSGTTSGSVGAGTTSGMSGGMTTGAGDTRRDSPNGSAGSMPKATTGPNSGDPSTSENGKH